jgi:hypothetical protein
MNTQTQHIKANERTAILSLLKQMIHVLESTPTPPSSYKKPSLKLSIRADFQKHFKNKWCL